ncbi:asparagine synthetase B [Candidatus Thorarchaeota archaeon]|nr:MAG: asparagine synthetase B [Candidatus Thorarchaeota archaeon]
MVCITGAFPLEQDDASESRVRSAVETLAHRGPPKLLQVRGPHDISVILAVQMHEEHTTDVRQQTGELWIADGWDSIEGRLEILQKGLYPAELLNRDNQALSVYLTSIGDLIVLRIDAMGMSIVRSRLSFKPIHYQLHSNTILFSTERKALWKLGVEDPSTVLPGQLLSVTWDGKLSIAWRVPNLEPRIDRTRDQVAFRGQLSAELTDSFNKVSGQKVGVLFSGGVDSSLVAHLAERHCREVQLYTCYAQGSRDRRAAQEAADILEQSISFIEMDEDLVWSTLPELLYAIERVKRKDVEIAMPFLLASKQARRDGLRLLLSGQGPDELFAGYARYVEMFRRHGHVALEQRLWEDVSSTHDKNIERDELAAAFGGCDLFFPYLSGSFIQSAMAIPARYKIQPDKSPERKVIFREMATEMGLDETLARKAKKATQYSSGSARLLLRSMKRHVEELADATKKVVYRSMDLVLSYIAGAIGIPGHPTDLESSLTVNLSAAHEFKKRL